MNKMKKILCLLTGAMLLSPLAMAAKIAPVAKAVTTTTLENLLYAYNGESNAQAKYLEFAKKAQAEGYLRAAKLFAAVAMSEGIHAAQHAKVIKALKGKAKATLVPATVGTTQENLAAALAGETAEIEKMYPEFIKQAELEKQVKAVRSFSGAKGIEAIHADWFKQALADLENWKADSEFYTCKVCGNVVAKLDFEYCSICQAPVNEFVAAK